ncbi:MAG: hypothetical protein K2N44_17955 [Lachnospiraceae bacterium]|nr:hypothetical protein [Lachnospiraceae bacterium]
MAVRPIYQSQVKAPFFKIIDVNFQFFSGFSASQKQKSIESLHNQYNESYPDHTVLEISSKSKCELGVALSAFNLNLKTPQNNCSVECAFQGSKVFEGGGPYVDLLDKSSREAKKDTRLHESGKLIAFQYFEQKFLLEPKDYFYNWLYSNALMQNQDLSNEIIKFDSFSDIEFNPQKSINCQAKAAAVFVGLSTQHLLEEALLSPESFLKIVYVGILNVK